MCHIELLCIKPWANPGSDSRFVFEANISIYLLQNNYSLILQYVILEKLVTYMSLDSYLKLRNKVRLFRVKNHQA